MIQSGKIYVSYIVEKELLIQHVIRIRNGI